MGVISEWDGTYDVRERERRGMLVIVCSDIHALCLDLTLKYCSDIQVQTARDAR